MRVFKAFSFVRVVAAVVFIAALGFFAASWSISNMGSSPLTRSEMTPLGAPPQTDGGGSYAFETSFSDGSPVAFDPCRPISYVIRFKDAPPEAEELIHGAVSTISEATGLQFEYEGVTNELPSTTRPSYDYALYGARWSPVLISWTGPSEVPDLNDNVLGRGGATALTVGSDAVYVTGSVELDGPDLNAMFNEVNGAARVQAVIVHELGHLVGLGHVDDPAELMYPTLSDENADLGPGDRSGLSALGQGACFDGLDDPAKFHIEPQPLSPLLK